jgi:hypothetical protein
MAKLTKKQIKMIATIHSAIHLSYIDICMFDEGCGLTDEEQSLIIEEINSIAIKLSKGEAMNLGSTKGVIDYVRGKF